MGQFGAVIGEVGKHSEHLAVDEYPIRGQDMLLAFCGGELCAGKLRHDLPAPRPQQVADQREPLMALRRRARIPIQHRGAKRCFFERVQNIIAQFGVGGLELLPAAFAHRIR